MPIDIQPADIGPIDSKDDAQVQAKLDTLVRKDIGAPITIADVQRKRVISCVALVIDEKGLYSLVVSHQEKQVDGAGEPVGVTVSGATKVPDKDLTDDIKTAIDSIYTAAIAAI
jgi:hypothetical protein